MASITVLSDVIMPHSLISVGVRGKNMRRNTRTQARNGRMQINVDSDITQRQYEFASVPLTITQWQELEGLHEVTDGGAFGFLLPDPKDASATIAQGVATLITGTTYQLKKRYTSAGSTRTKDRKITRPVAAGFVIKVSGTPLVSGSGYTLNADTGVVTIPSAPSASTITWSGSFHVPVHFLSDELDWDLVRSGQYDSRLVAGPNVMLIEVIE